MKLTKKVEKRTTFCIFMVFAFLFTACGKNTQTWQELYDLGEKYLLEENYEEAIVAFTSAIELEPREAVTYIGRGDAYAAYQDMENHLELALADYEQALDLDESIPDAYQGIAEVYVQQGDYELALKMLQEGVEKAQDTKAIQDKMSKVEELVQQRVKESAVQAISIKLQERENSLGYIDAENYKSDKTGISSYVLLDMDADGIDELLITYMSGSFSGELDGGEIWIELYDFQDGEVIQIAEQQIGTVGYCDAMSVRLFFSEQQAAFCIVTNKELIGAYTGVREFVNELYRISPYNIVLRRHWSQNNIENLYDGPDKIIAEMQRVGIPYMDMIYFQYGTEFASDAKEQILFRNTVGVQGEDARDRQYELYFSTYEELNVENGTNEFRVGQSEAQMLKTRSEAGRQEDELKESAREVLRVVENLYRGSNGVEIDLENYITGPGYPSFDDFYAEAVGFQSMEEVKGYVHSMVSDSIYEKYFDEEKYMEADGKVFFRISTSGSKMDMDSLEIESIDGDIYRISIDEYLGQEYYLHTALITLQKTDEGWKALEEQRDAIDKGYTKRYSGTEGDFI